MAILAFHPPPPRQATQGNKKRQPFEMKRVKEGGKKKIVLYSFRRHFL
jgi:hypothetical protein